MKYKLINSWYRFNDVCAIVEDENENKLKKCFPARWFFAIKNSDKLKAEELLYGKYVVSFNDDPNFPRYTKIYCQDRYDESPIQDKYDIVMFLEDHGIETYEGDLMNNRRWYIDRQFDIYQNYSKLYFDIETDDSISKIEVGRDRILSFSAIDSKGVTFFYVCNEQDDDSEKKLLENVLSLFSKYDIVLGWNSSKFDVPYLKLRMKKYNLNKSGNYIWKEIASIDLLKRFRHIFRFDSSIKSFSLDNVSKHFLGKGKIERKEKIIELFKNNKKKLKEYNIEDSILVKELDEKLKVSEMMIRQSSWCKVPISQFGLYSIIDAVILNIAHQNGIFCRTSVSAIKERKNPFRNQDTQKPSQENPDDTDTSKGKYIGAAVLEPKIGKYKKVYSFDFKGLYPSIILTSNIGYDSIFYEKKENCIINPGTQMFNRKEGKIKQTFFSKKPSVIAMTIAYLIDKRKEYKDLKLKMIEDGSDSGPDWDKVVSDEIIVKEMSNSTYGIMGLEYGRYYSIDVAESITLMGQYCLDFAKIFFEKQGCSVIYGDTDSIFISTDEKIDIENKLENFHKELKIELKNKYNIDKSFIQLNFDKEYDSFILISKKTYVGEVVNIEGKKTKQLYARGLDYIKRNTFSYAAKKQKDLVQYLLSKNPTKNEVREYINEIKKEFFNSNFSSKELTIIARIGRSLDDYKKTPPLHVRLAKELEKKIGMIYKNTEIEYIVTNSSGKNLDGELIIDWSGKYSKEYYWENKTVPLLERVLKPCYDYDFFNLQLNLFQQ